MKRPIRKVAMLVVILMAALVVNLNWQQVVRSDALRQDPGNTRVLLDEYQRQRGSIVVAGTPIAMSEATQDQLKYLRTYPLGPQYAAITGYYSIVYGATGMEKAANDVLSGTDSRLVGANLSDLFSGRDPKGGNVVLTIDPAAQQAAYDALTATGQVGGIVAMDPRTGAVLALVSTPSYDPTALSSHQPGAIREAADQLSAQDPDPRSNQALTENYPPGSIFKIVVAAAAIENGLSIDDQIPAPDVYIPPGTATPLNNFGNQPCTGSEMDTLRHSFTISCNTTFAKLAVDQIGEDRLRAMAERFGIDGEPFSIPLPVAGSALGDIADNPALAQTAIGQRDVRFTVMQAVMLSAIIANDGQLMTPHLIAQTQAPDLSVLDQTTPQVAGEPAVSADVAADITEMMISVVENGSGTSAQVPGVEVAGKTGTAQVAEGVNDHTWFTGFAPAGDPRIAVAVFIRNGGGTGGELSAPIAAEVIEAYLDSGGGN